MSYSSTSKQLAVDIQEIALKLGYRTNLIFTEDQRENRVGMWRVLIDTSDNDTIVIAKEQCEMVGYNGKVYSLNVPNHIYITSRNGKIAIQGNTATVKAILYERMINSFQKKISRAVEHNIFNVLLKVNGMEDNVGFISFNSVTEQDEAMRAKWMGDLMKGFRQSSIKPFTINEIRAKFSIKPFDIPEANTLMYGEGSDSEEKDDDNDEDVSGDISEKPVEDSESELFRLGVSAKKKENDVLDKKLELIGMLTKEIERDINGR